MTCRSFALRTSILVLSAFGLSAFASGGSVRSYGASKWRESPICEPTGWCWAYPVLMGGGELGNLGTITGTSSSDVWVAATNGGVLHFDGRSWVRTETGGHGWATTLFAPKEGEAWAFFAPTPSIKATRYEAAQRANPGRLFRWTGKTWEYVQVPGVPNPLALRGMGMECWVFGATRGAHWNGARWKGFSLKEPAVLGSGALPLAVLPDGRCMMWQNQEWKAMPPPRPRLGRPLSAWASSPNDAWVFYSEPSNPSGGFHWDGLRWSFVTLPSVHATPYQLWGSGPDDLHGIERDGSRVHWNGERWLEAPPASFKWVGGSGPKQAFAVGSSEFGRWDGTQWHKEERTPMMSDNALWVAGPDDVWVTGSIGGVWRWRGEKWEGPEVLPGPNDIWGASDDEVFVTADRGMLVRVIGDELELITTESRDELESVWGRGSNDVWAVGKKGAVVHWDGSSATLTRVGAVDLLKVTGGPSGEPWVFGANGSLLRHAGGERFVPVEIPRGLKVHKLAAGTVGPLVFAGDDEGATTLLIYTSDGVRERSLSETSSRLRKSFWVDGRCEHVRIFSVWVNSEDDFWLGGDLDRTVGIGHWNGRELDRFLDVHALTYYDREGTQPSAELAAQEEGRVPVVDLTWVGGPNDLWAEIDGAGFRFDGRTWRMERWSPVWPLAHWKGKNRLWIVGPQAIAWKPLDGVGKVNPGRSGR